MPFRKGTKEEEELIAEYLGDTTSQIIIIQATIAPLHLSVSLETRKPNPVMLLPMTHTVIHSEQEKKCQAISGITPLLSLHPLQKRNWRMRHRWRELKLYENIPIPRNNLLLLASIAEETQKVSMHKLFLASQLLQRSRP